MYYIKSELHYRCWKTPTFQWDVLLHEWAEWSIWRISEWLGLRPNLSLLGGLAQLVTSMKLTRSISGSIPRWVSSHHGLSHLRVQADSWGHCYNADAAVKGPEGPQDPVFPTTPLGTLLLVCGLWVARVFTMQKRYAPWQSGLPTQGKKEEEGRYPLCASYCAGHPRHRP